MKREAPDRQPQRREFHTRNRYVLADLDELILKCRDNRARAYIKRSRRPFDRYPAGGTHNLELSGHWPYSYTIPFGAQS